MKRRETITVLILDWLLMVPGVIGSVFCLITAFSLPASWELWAIALSAVTLFSISLGHQKRDRVTAPLLLLLIVVPGYLFRVELIESFRNLWGVLSTIYARGYDFFQDYVPQESTNKETVGTALLFLTVLEAYFCCLSVRVWKRTTPAALSLLPCVAPCFVLIDTPPALLPLLAVIFAILTQAFSQSVRRRAAGEQGKAVFAAALVSAAILGLLITLYPQDTYSPPITWEELAEKMDRWKQQRNNRGNVSAGLTGNPSTVDLSGLDSLPNHPYAVFYVTSSRGGHLYLRGSSYVDFDGTVWSRNVKESWDKSTVYPYLGVFGEETVSIETIEPESLLYTTYDLTEMQDGTSVSDAYMRNDAQLKTYSMQFTAQAGPVVPDPRYDKWVREHCLALPERTRTGVLAWWNAQDASHNGMPVDDPDALLQYAKDLANAVSRSARYSRNPVHMPENVDFCTWFLSDAKDGYCVHFASSCVALLRAQGIPARYVSGYVCDAAAKKQTRVTNLQAHAWVEAWIGGRWVVIEPTPSDATEFTGQINQPVVQQTEDSFDPASDKNRPKPSETRDHISYTKPKDPKVPTTEVVVGPSGTIPTPYDPNKKDDDGQGFRYELLLIYLGVLSIPLLIVGRRRLKLRRREKKYVAAEPNEKARLLYRRMLRMQKVGGGEVPEAALGLVKKARFSQHTLTDDELNALRQVCSEQISRLHMAGFWKRNYCKYVLALF